MLAAATTGRASDCAGRMAGFSMGHERSVRWSLRYPGHGAGSMPCNPLYVFYMILLILSLGYPNSDLLRVVSACNLS